VLAAALFLAIAGSPAAPAAACQTGRIAVGDRCATGAEIADRIRAVVERTMRAADLKAALLAVSVGDTAVLTRAWGESMSGVPATPDMHFRNGAIAIPYLTTLLLQLHDEGLLSLDDPVARWFPDYRDAERITLRMLGDNTAGYPDYVYDIPLYQDVFRQWTPDELIATAMAKPMTCEPGTCFSYSHMNYVILGEILQRVGGKPVEMLLRERILDPLGLDDTRSESTPAIQQPVLHAFTDERGIYEDSTYWNPSWTLAQGAVMTTSIGDALASIVAIGSGRLVSAGSYRTMLEPTTAGFPPMTPDLYYGLGVVVTNGWVMQTPSFGGYSAAVGYLPDRRIGFAVSTTIGPKTPDERITNRLAVAIGAVLAPDKPPRLPTR
jgi:CubicO group peptidase (beta-lactamase class C family)